ncbi:MAG TPA: phosphoglucosamine mutase [Armatimonadota bacterium]|jgi:phosphomannomutase
MMPLKLSVLGVRGVVGEALTPEMVAGFAGAFGTYAGGGRICIARDTRPSGEMLRSALLSGLIATGCQVEDMGVCLTPSLQWWIKEQGAAGGIALTAGHNSEEWNAIKFFGLEGRMLNAYQGEELLDVYHAGDFTKAPWDKLSWLKELPGSAGEAHSRAVLAAIDVSAIRAARFRVAVDCCNGAMSTLLVTFLRESLGCTVYPINNDPRERFPHTPEPNPTNMSQVKALVDATGADVGFCLDADGERVSVVTNEGTALSEEVTLCLAALDRLDPEGPYGAADAGPVVANVSTTLAIDEICRSFGVPCFRSRVGQPYLVEALGEQQAKLAGEGSGGIIWPELHTAQDALMTICRLLEGRAKASRPFSYAASRVPNYFRVKQSVQAPPERAYTILQRVREQAEEDAENEGATLDLTEGVRWVWPDASVHVRSSLTEPIIRILAEAKSQERAQQLCTLHAARLHARLA